MSTFQDLKTDGPEFYDPDTKQRLTMFISEGKLFLCIRNAQNKAVGTMALTSQIAFTLATAMQGIIVADNKEATVERQYIVCGWNRETKAMDKRVMVFTLLKSQKGMFGIKVSGLNKDGEKYRGTFDIRAKNPIIVNDGDNDAISSMMGIKYWIHWLLNEASTAMLLTREFENNNKQGGNGGGRPQYNGKSGGNNYNRGNNGGGNNYNRNNNNNAGRETPPPPPTDDDDDDDKQF